MSSELYFRKRLLSEKPFSVPSRTRESSPTAPVRFSISPNALGFSNRLRYVTTFTPPSERVFLNRISNLYIIVLLCYLLFFSHSYRLQIYCFSLTSVVSLTEGKSGGLLGAPEEHSCGCKPHGCVGRN